MNCPDRMQQALRRRTAEALQRRRSGRWRQRRGPTLKACDAAAMPAPIDHALRLRSLWTCWLLAMLFHVDLGLMPLFHGLSPEIESHVDPAVLPLLFTAMLVYFLIPLGSILLISWQASDPAGAGRPRARAWRRWHAWISVVYTVTNVPHLLADILVPDSRPDQVALMLVLVLLGLLINREAWIWWRQSGAPTGPG
jgi:hypothetical protein